MLLGAMLASAVPRASADPAAYDVTAPAEALEKALGETAAGIVSEADAAQKLEAWHRDPRFPPLDRALTGAQLRTQIAAIGAIAKSVWRLDYGTNNVFLSLLRRELRQAMQPVARGGGGLGDRLALAAGQVDAAKEAEGLLRALSHGYHTLVYYDGGRSLYEGVLQRWADQKVFTNAVEKTGDVGYALRLVDARPLAVADAAELARVAARSFDKWMRRALPLTQDELQAAIARGVDPRTGDETFELFTRLAQRRDTRPEDRARLHAALREELEQLPRRVADSAAQRGAQVSTALHESLWAAFGETGLALQHARLGAEYALTRKVPGLTERLLQSPEGVAALRDEIVDGGHDFVKRFAEMGVTLDPKVARTFFHAVLDKGPANFTARGHYRERRPAELSEAFFEAMSEHYDLRAHPQAEAFLLAHLAELHQRYQKLPVTRSNGSRRLHGSLPEARLSDVMEGMGRILAIAPRFGQDTFHAVSRDIFFANEWYRDPYGGEGRHLRTLIRTFLQHADVMAHDHATHPATRSALLHDRAVLAPLYTELGKPDLHHDWSTHTRLTRNQFGRSVGAAVRAGLPLGAPRTK